MDTAEPTVVPAEVPPDYLAHNTETPGRRRNRLWMVR